MSALRNRLGFALRETGQALDRLGCRLGGTAPFEEVFWRHRTFQNLGTSAPRAADAAFVAPSASLVGDVALGPGASVWPGAVLRGDGGAIRVGAASNLQDGVVARTAAANPGESAAPITLGDRVTVGHGASLGPGVRVGDGSLVGMGASLGAGVVVEPGAMVAAGAVVAPGTVVTAGALWGGVPAKLMRALKKEEAAFLPESAARYEALGREYAAGGASAPTRG